MRQHLGDWRRWQADFSFHVNIKTITQTNLINLHLQLPLPETHHVLDHVENISFFDNIGCFSNSGLETFRPY